MEASARARSSAAEEAIARRARRALFPPHPVKPPWKQNYDRFIPNRSAMDFDMAHYLLTESKEVEKKLAMASPSREAYQKALKETLMKDATRILAFKSRPPVPAEGVFQQVCSGIPSSHKTKLVKRRRHVPQHPERTLDAPDLLDDYYLNLLDWGRSNHVAIALGHSVYFWDASRRSASEFMNVEEDDGPVTSVSWAPDGRHIAIGLDCSNVQIWDSSTHRLLRTLRGLHQSRVGCLAWNGNLLTTGGTDGLIVNNDVRARNHRVQTYRGHRQDVCGLKWSSSGQQLASGGNDDLVYVWDLSTASRSTAQGQNQWLHRFDDHTAAVKALAWCPFQSNLLASGGGESDRCIKFWNTHTGARLKSVDTGSQVCALLWNKNERELLSSHGFPENGMTLWKYPSMDRVAQLAGHTSRVLFMAQSPDGCMVASAGADETLRFWNVFGSAEAQKPERKTANAWPLMNFNSIR